jgi:hypothetical protein
MRGGAGRCGNRGMSHIGDAGERCSSCAAMLRGGWCSTVPRVGVGVRQGSEVLVSARPAHAGRCIAESLECVGDDVIELVVWVVARALASAASVDTDVCCDNQLEST